MQIAICRASIPSKVDHEKGIVYGCILAKVNALAVFSSPGNGPTEVLITPSVIDGQLALWKKKDRGDAHWTHSWIEEGDDALKTRVATWRNFRKDEEGNLIADAHLWPSEHRAAILHAAENDPQGMMVSQVFDYRGGRDNAVPVNVRAADFVGIGAATTALLSKFSDIEEEKQKSMTKAELIALLQDPEVKAAVLGGITLPVAGLSSAEVDNKITAALSAHKAKELDSDCITAVLTQAEARLVSRIGATPGTHNFSVAIAQGDVKKRVEDYITAVMSAGCRTRGAAIARLTQDNSALYNEAVDAKVL